MKTTAWCITMWLTPETGYTAETINVFTQAMPNDWSLEGQMEQGHNSGKLHYQLLLKTPQTRGTRVQKYFPKCTIDQARKFHALQQYVHKTDTRVGEFKTVENRSPQWKTVRNRFFDWILTEKTDYGFFGVVDEERMKLWDTFIGLSLREGMEVDIIGVNPQYRSCIQRYWADNIQMALDRVIPVDKIDRQTNRQDLEVAELSIPTLAEGGGTSSVQIPEIVAPSRIRRVVRAHLPK